LENLKNGKQYVGSGVDLKARLSFYYSNSGLDGALTRGKSYIYSAILKHGLENFSLTILEYCDKEKCREKEDCYLTLLDPEYNILPKAGSLLGFKHSDETRALLSSLNKGENNPMFGMTGRTGENHPNFGKPRPEGAGSPAQKIEVFDKETNKTTSYDSLGEAARALNINYRVISNYFRQNQEKPYKKRYIFKKVG
jgi:group I intron endonuclease